MWLSWDRPLALVALLLLGSYVVGSAVASGREVPPAAPAIVLDPAPATTPSPPKVRKPAAPTVREKTPHPPVVRPTPKRVQLDDDGEWDDDDGDDDSESDDD